MGAIWFLNDCFFPAGMVNSSENGGPEGPSSDEWMRCEGEYDEQTPSG